MNTARVTLTFDSCLHESPCTLPQGQLAPTGLQDRATTSRPGQVISRAGLLLGASWKGLETDLLHPRKVRTQPC